MILRKIIGITSTLLLMTACSSDPPVVEETAMDEVPTPTQQVSADWGYGPDNGPEHWGKLNAAYSTCETGRTQSPIDLKWSRPVKNAPRIEANYTDSQATVINKGYTPRIEISGTNQLMINGQAYTLEGIEFHSPSEHRLSGTALSLEIQLMHKAVKGDKMAIISLFAIEGRENALINEVMSQLANGDSSGFQLNASKLLPPRKTFYHYKGSVTTPPCTENVEWIVYNTPMELSRDQIIAFRATFPQNNRPVQPLNGRSVQNY